MQNFNYHSHTYRCGHADMDMMDYEYVEEYIKMGFKKIAFTDHCPEKNKVDKRINMRMEYEQREEYLSSIKQLKEKYADEIDIKVGYEVEYLPGEEENLLELKNESDVIILGQHFVYDDNYELAIVHRNGFNDEEIIRYAEYIKKAIQLRIPDIIGHPDIYMLKRNSFGDIERKAAHMICQVCEEYRIPLEINLNSIYYRVIDGDKILKDKISSVKYPCREFWEIVSNYDIKVLYGIDAHHRGQICKWNQLVEVANEIIGKEIIEKLNFIEE